MKHSSLIAGIVAVLLIVITLPVYFTISGLSFMAFDNADSIASLWPWAMVGLVVGISLITVIGSLVGSLMLIRRKKIWPGVGVSLLPIIVLGIFWLWVSTQSFS